MFYPLFTLGIMFLPADRLSIRERNKIIIDIIIIMTAAGLIFWNFIIEPILLSGRNNTLALALSAAYPTLDVVLLFALVDLLYRRQNSLHIGPVLFLVAAMAVSIASDIYFSVQSNAETYVSGGIVDFGYFVSYSLFGLAGILQVKDWKFSAKGISKRARFDQSTWTRYLPYIGVSIAYILLIWKQGHLLASDLSVTTLGVGGIIGLVLVRQIMALDENNRLYLETRKENDGRVKVEEALQDSKRSLTDIINFLPDATFVIDQGGQVISWNRAMEEMTGLRKEDIIGKGDYSYAIPFYGEPRPILIDIIDEHDEKAESGYLNVERKGRTIYAEAYAPSLFNGKGAFVWATASVLYNSFGKRIGAIEAIRDITERKKAEKELKSAMEAAEAATKVKSEFLANMSHEIRTPMNAIIGLTGLLLDESLTPGQKDDVRTICKSGESLLAIINDILDLSKIEGGRVELDCQPFDLRNCIEESLELVAVTSNEKGLDLKYAIEDDTPESLMGDYSRLRQVLVNLLSNAVKFTDKGKVSILVTGQRLDRNRHEVHFAVKDTGIGIPEDKMSRLFLPFSQIDSTTTRKYGGTGLGLNISKRLIEMMGGRIWAESRVGNGSTFHFTINVDDASIKPFNKVVPQLEVDLHDNNGKNLSILLAEDNIVNQRVMFRMLKKLGYKAEIAANGLEVLEALNHSHYDVILMDVQMPMMDGLEATRFIRQNWPDGPKIIAITAYALKGDREKCIEAGMDEYISKPVKITELQTVLKPFSRPSKDD
jgi:PAS domain S-box-containing protein